MTRDVAKCFKRMERDLHYGRFWPIAFFNNYLGAKIHTQKFGIGIYALTVKLETMGFALSSAGLRGTGYRILPASANRFVIHRKMKSSVTNLQRAVILGENTDHRNLLLPERDQLDAATDGAKFRLKLLQNVSEVRKLCAKHKPKFMED